MFLAWVNTRIARTPPTCAIVIGRRSTRTIDCRSSGLSLAYGTLRRSFLCSFRTFLLQAESCGRVQKGARGREEAFPFGRLVHQCTGVYCFMLCTQCTHCEIPNTGLQHMLRTAFEPLGPSALDSSCLLICKVSRITSSIDLCNCAAILNSDQL